MIGLVIPLELWEDASEDTEALLEDWLVAVGDRVATGQPLATAVIVKTSVELVAPADGVIEAILVSAGETFARGTNLAMLAPAAEAATPVAAPAPTPVAAPVAAPVPPSRLVPFSGLRGTIARNLSLAWQAPRVAAGVDVDMSAALAHLEELRRGADDLRLTLTPLFIRAAALALRAHPRLNALVTEQGVEQMDAIHIALAVSLEDGLLTPVIRDADTRSVADLAAEAARLAALARAGTLPPSALQGGTFTVSNLGAAGIDWFTPVLNPPQVAILGVARVVERPVVRGGQLAVAPCTTLTLVFDHRAIDGDPAARFLATLRDLLEEPSAL
jgi:pyruvate/2-oxoglutarate dehydrogenase complex dihydrolipoamide acyltransferase (E2) component